LDRERIKLESQEKKLIADIKRSAKNGQMGACKIQAKDLVRTRRSVGIPSLIHSPFRGLKTPKSGVTGSRPLLVALKLTGANCRYIQKFVQMKTQLQAVSLRIQTVRSNEQMMQSMKGATGLLSSMNRSMNLPALQRIAMEFEKENDIMDQRQEMMDDAIDDVTGLDDEEETDEVVSQVLDEIGVDLNQALGETPTGLPKNAVSEGKVAQAIGAEDDDLQSRLDNLRR
jgi:charged multivesicular body protein 2A